MIKSRCGCGDPTHCGVAEEDPRDSDPKIALAWAEYEVAVAMRYLKALKPNHAFVLMYEVVLEALKEDPDKPDQGELFQ